MSKQRKKRTKRYQGSDQKQPIVRNVKRYTAVERSGFGEWWHKRKKLVKRVSLTVLIVGLVVWFIIEATALIFHR